MNILRSIFCILVIALLWKIDANIQITQVPFSSYYGTLTPLTGTEPKSVSMYPLTKWVLVNESSVNRVPLGYVKVQGNSELATKNAGGK